MKEELSTSPISGLPPPLTLPPSAIPTPPSSNHLTFSDGKQPNYESDEDKYFDDDDVVIDDLEYTPRLSYSRRPSITPSSSVLANTPRHGPTTGTPLIDHPQEEIINTAVTSSNTSPNNSFNIIDTLPPLTLPQPALSTNESVLPPPPSRSCTIIQTVPSDMSSKAKNQSGGRRKRSKKDETPLDDEQRKKARRTSHSDIERRRRLKINEQFEALRQLVPACSQLTTAKRGGDIGLHKLDILQESVAFIKHLIECVNTIEKRLMQQNGNQSNAPSPLVLPSINSTTNVGNTITPSISRQSSITSLPSNYSLKTKHEPQSPLHGPRDNKHMSLPMSMSAPATALQSPLINANISKSPLLTATHKSKSVVTSPIPSSTDTSKLKIANLVG